MGKASRTKAARRLQSPATVEHLHQAVIAVAERFGTQPRCIEGVALLQQTAAHLGLAFTPRPVGVIVRNDSADTFVFLGSAGEEHLPQDRRDAIIDQRPPGQGRAGHLVLTSSTPLLLLDPTLAQTANAGVEMPAIMMRIPSEHPAGGLWQASVGNARVAYLPVDDDTRLLSGYDTVLAEYAHEAQQLAREIRR